MAAGLSIAKPDIKPDVTPRAVPHHSIAGAIRQAAAATGANFGYLLATAKIESSFDPKASAATSSARGLFQFIEQTWLGTVKEAGQALGYGHYAAAISRLPSGSFAVADPALRADILKLRYDPAISASMAGVLTRSNGARLSRAIGRPPSDAELYIAHFMGTSAAGKLIANAASNPRLPGAGLFPAAASANRPIFFHRDGTARDVAGVYRMLTSRYAAAVAAPATRAMMALQDTPPVATATASAHAAMTVAGQTELPSASAGKRPAAPIFRTLFQVGARADAVSPMVSKLWGRANAQPAYSMASMPAASQAASFDERWRNVPTAAMQGLFSDHDGRFSG